MPEPMVSAVMDCNVTGRSGSSNTATTALEAKKYNAATLVMSSQKLQKFPEGLRGLASLTALDVSNNPHIGVVPEAALPPCLVELTLTGCELTALPAGLKGLKKLQKLFAGANKITDLAVVLACPALQHAGLAFNRIAQLPPAEALAAAPASLLSLDLSHNDLQGVHDTTLALAALPGLASLSLGGNPLCLSERYQAVARTNLRKLVLLDGQRMDASGGSRPSTSQQQQQNSCGRGSHGSAPMHHSSMAVHFSDAAGPEATCVQLELSGLSLADDPFAWLRERWQDQISSAEELGLAAAPALYAPVPPLQPVVFHFELSDNQGTPLASIPLKLLPPTPPDIAAMFDPKLKAAAAAAAKDKKPNKPPSATGKPGSAKGFKGRQGAADPLEATAEQQLQPGRLLVRLPVQPCMPDRNWLRNGVQISLYQTTLTAVERPPAEGAALQAKAPAKAAPKGKKTEDAPPVQYDIVSSQSLVGIALMRAGASVVDGYTTLSEEELEFRPPPALVDDKGIRMALKDGRHAAHTVATLQAALTMHAAALPPAAQ